MQKGRLSVKEIEALALIAQGHDAKSAASELSVSTHTIYERLRRAREKLGVSNSREAARLFFNSKGSEAEGQAQTATVLHDSVQLSLDQYTRLSPDDDSGKREGTGSYVPLSFLEIARGSLPVRPSGARSFEATVNERIRLIGDLASRLSMAFVSICLAALVISNLVSHR